MIHQISAIPARKIGDLQEFGRRSAAAAGFGGASGIAVALKGEEFNAIDRAVSHRLLDCPGRIVNLQIQEDLLALVDDALDDDQPALHEQLQADFIKADVAAQVVYQL